MSITVPTGLQKWNRRVAAILKKPFPPTDASEPKQTPHWDKLSTWSLVCEEVLDTEPDPGLLKQYYGELLRRGFSDSDIQEMRHFAWLTVGWLNFEKALWEWCILDEADIRRAIEWQRQDGLIDEEIAAWMQAFVNERIRSSAAPNGPATSVEKPDASGGPPSVS